MRGKRSAILGAYGTAGDAIPMAAVGREMIERGWTVRFVGSPALADLMSQLGFESVALATTELTDQVSSELTDQALRGMSAALASWRHGVVADLHTRAVQLEGIIAGHDIALFHPLLFSGHIAAEVARVPWVGLSPLPALYPSDSMPPPGLQSRSSVLPSPLSVWARWRAAELISMAVLDRDVNRARRQLGLRPRRRVGTHGHQSKVANFVLAEPAIWPVRTSPLVHQVGLPPLALVAAEYEPPSDVGDLIDRDRGPLVGVSLGTFPGPKSVCPDVVVAAVRQAAPDARVMVMGAHLESGDDWTIATGHLPHDWLLPQLDLLVHHGGMGTATAAVRSATPSVIVPGTYDQPTVASRLASVGVAVSSGPSPRALGDAVDRALTLRSALKARCVELRSEFIGHRAANVAADAIERLTDKEVQVA